MSKPVRARVPTTEGWRRITNRSVSEDERSESGGERSSTTVIGEIDYNEREMLRLDGARVSERQEGKADQMESDEAQPSLEGAERLIWLN